MPKKSPAKSGPTKSDVIRSMPNASAADIIKKAKSLGLKLTANHVYAVRAIDKRRGRPARGGGGAPGVDIGSGKRSSKTAFIRGFASDLPAAKIVEEAKRAGVKISKEYVYRVRALTKPGVGNGRRGIGRAGSSHAGSEQRLTSLALEIGLLRAVALLERVRARLAN